MPNAPLRRQSDFSRDSEHSKLEHSRNNCQKAATAAAAAAVNSELVNALSSPAARLTPCDRFAMDAAMTRFLLRNSKLHVQQLILITFAVNVRFALTRTGPLKTVCASSNRSAAWRFGSQGTEAHRRPRRRCALDALLAACAEVATKTAFEIGKCHQCGCGCRSATGERSEQTSCARLIHCDCLLTFPFRSILP